MNAQNDSIKLKNENILVGEVKTISKGILVIETSYSDKDFRVEFNKVNAFNIQRKCLIILTNGRRRFGHVKSDADDNVTITKEDGTLEYIKIDEIIELREVDDKFWHRFKVYIDLGFNITKANKNRQFNFNGKLNYTGESWLLDGTVNALNSAQDDADRTRRTEANINIIRLLEKKWYFFGDVSYLMNTEQALDGRLSPSVGAGKFIVGTSKLYLTFGIGFTYNIEYYSDESLDKTSSELFTALNFNMFDYEDISLVTGLKFYPSLSENGRIRSDFNISIKYDLPLDFYISMGLTINYDNQSAIIGNKYDYIFTSGFGWSFD